MHRKPGSIREAEYSAAFWKRTAYNKEKIPVEKSKAKKQY